MRITDGKLRIEDIAKSDPVLAKGLESAGLVRDASVNLNEVRALRHSLVNADLFARAEKVLSSDTPLREDVQWMWNRD